MADGVPRRGAAAKRRRMRFVVTAIAAGLLHLSSALAASVASTVPGPGARRNIVVSFRPTGALIKDLQGVDGGPIPTFSTTYPGHAPPLLTLLPANVTSAYLAARVTLVRTHDYFGIGDIDSSFAFAFARPMLHGREKLDIFRDLSADPDTPASYNFAPTDRLVRAITGLGADALFRVGRSVRATPNPPDAAKYAAIVSHVVQHYNLGWDHGYRHQVKYWEVWNEPDLGGVFWAGTPAQYYGLYSSIARAIKAVDPGSEVGGPALSDAWSPSPYREGFLRFVRGHDLPLDFFSWHDYAVDADDPFEFVRVARRVRTQLDRFGFINTKSFLDEWNYGIVGADLEATTAQRAAFTASAMIYMQDAPIDRAALYRGDNNFGMDGTTPDQVGEALIFLGRMQDTRYRLPQEGGDTDGFGVLAGRNAAGTRIQVLISNYEIPAANRRPRPQGDTVKIPGLAPIYLIPRRTIGSPSPDGYTLTFKDMPPGDYTVARYRISASMTSELIDEETVHTPLRIESDLTQSGIELVIVTRD
jgi:xylan 1,4-beta-xylosidase